MSDGKTEAYRGTYWSDKSNYNWEYKDTKIKKQELPDARKHQIISFIKSGVRILGYGLLVINLPIAVSVLILSEVIGIIEELV